PLTTTSKYAFIPTTRAIAVLGDHGWAPVCARESGVRNERNHGYQRHEIRLRNNRFTEIAEVGDVLPEVVLINSHGGSSSFLLFAGFHEKVCSNGLIIHHDTAQTRIAHIGFADERVARALNVLGEMFPRMLELRKQWKEIYLDRSRQIAF